MRCSDFGRRGGARLVGGVGRGIAPLALHHGDALAVFLFQPLRIGRHHGIDGGAHAVHLLRMLGLEPALDLRDHLRLGGGVDFGLRFRDAPFRVGLPLGALGGELEIGGFLPEALRFHELVGDADARLLFHGEHLLAQLLLGFGDRHPLLFGDLFRRRTAARRNGCPLGLGGAQALGFRDLPGRLGGGQLLGDLALDDGGLLRLIILHLLLDQREAALGLRLPGDMGLVQPLLLRRSPGRFGVVAMALLGGFPGGLSFLEAQFLRGLPSGLGRLELFRRCGAARRCRFQAPLVLGGGQFRAQIVEPLLLAGLPGRLGGLQPLRFAGLPIFLGGFEALLGARGPFLLRGGQALLLDGPLYLGVLRRRGLQFDQLGLGGMQLLQVLDMLQFKFRKFLLVLFAELFIRGLQALRLFGAPDRFHDRKFGLHPFLDLLLDVGSRCAARSGGAGTRLAGEILLPLRLGFL